MFMNLWQRHVQMARRLRRTMQESELVVLRETFSVEKIALYIFYLQLAVDLFTYFGRTNGKKMETTFFLRCTINLFISVAMKNNRR